MKPCRMERLSLDTIVVLQLIDLATGEVVKQVSIKKKLDRKGIMTWDSASMRRARNTLVTWSIDNGWLIS